MAKITQEIVVSVDADTSKAEKKIAKTTDKLNKDFDTLRDTLSDISGINFPDVGKFAGLKDLGKLDKAILGWGGLGLAITAVGAGLMAIDTANRVFLESTGEVNSELVGNTKALAGFTGESTKNILNAAEAFKTAFGGESTEIVGLIETAIKKGANANGEFIDSLKEYSPQLKQIGLDGEQAFAFLTAAGRSGVFSDKAVDSVKEAGLRLREMTKATSDSLKPLRDGVEQQIRLAAAAGKTWEAMKLISKELRGDYLTEIQKATILADSFGSAGEDAGMKWVSGLDQINLNLESYSERISPITANTLELSKQWNKFTTEVLDGNGVLGTTLATVLKIASSVIGLANMKSPNANYMADVQSAYDKLNAFALENKNVRPPSDFDFKKKDVSFFSTLSNLLENTYGSNFANLKDGDSTKGTGISTAPTTSSEGKLSKGSPLAAESQMSGSGIKNLTINVTKMIDTVTITSAEDPIKMKEKLQQLLTQLILDTKLA